MFKGNKFIKGRDGGDYFSEEYVDWLEARLRDVIELGNQTLTAYEYEQKLIELGLDDES